MYFILAHNKRVVVLPKELYDERKPSILPFFDIC